MEDTETNKASTLLNEQFQCMNEKWDQDNVLKWESLEMKKNSLEMKRDWMAFEKESFQKRIDLDTVNSNIHKLAQIRAFEVECEAMEDSLDNPEMTDQKKRRIQQRMLALEEKIEMLRNINLLLNI